MPFIISTDSLSARVNGVARIPSNGPLGAHNQGLHKYTHIAYGRQINKQVIAEFHMSNLYRSLISDK